MKHFLIFVLVFFTVSLYSQRIEDQFTKQNWTEFHILTEDCVKMNETMIDDEGNICPVYYDEQGFCFFVTINEGHVYTIDITCHWL